MDLRRFSHEAVLRDGSQVLIRAIRSDDKQRLFEGFHHLSNQSISFRFFTRKKDLTENELKYLTEVDFNHHVAIVAELQNKDKENDIGVGRYVELKDKSPERVAEIAFTVDDKYQGRGVGTLLFQHLIAFAQKQGISRLVADILLNNKSMLKIIKHSGFKLETKTSYGVAHIEFNIEKKHTVVEYKMNSHLGNNQKICLALGSGSARGLAHIGVIHALEEAGIKIDCVAGTSMGALIGSVYASGKLEALEKVYAGFDWKKIAYFFDMVFPKSGLIDGKKVADFVCEYIHAETIEHLPLPFQAVATDIGTGEEVTLDQGDVIEAVRASISVPGIFTPIHRNGRVLVDGGLVNPVPVSTARSMGADFVIAVDLNHDIVAGKAPKKDPKSAEKNPLSQALHRIGGKQYSEAMERINHGLQSLDNPALDQIRAWLAEEPLPNIFEVLLSSINVMETQITQTRLRIDSPDLLIQPNLGSIRFLEFNRTEEIISIGHEETQKQLKYKLI